MRLSIAALTLLCLWSRPALPCSQAALLGATAPAEGDTWPTDGDFWLHYNGAEEDITATLDTPVGSRVVLSLTRVDADLVQADLPSLLTNSAYVIRLNTRSGLDAPREIHFRAGGGPVDSPAIAPRWAADFDVQLESPCANTGLYVKAQIQATSGSHTVAWRLFDAEDMRPLGSQLAAGAEFPFELRRWVSATGGQRCVRLSAVRANAQVVPSADEFCFPARPLDAGFIDSGAPDADFPPWDAGSSRQDAGQPADTEAAGSLSTADAGCGCSAGSPATRGGYCEALVGFFGLLLLRRLRRSAAGGRRQETRPLPGGRRSWS